MVSAASADRIVVAASVAVVVIAVVARLHDVAAYPAMHDFDAGGHAVNVLDLRELHLPNPRSWCGSHPPLYYAIGAALWALLPEGVPVHVMLRWISVAASVAMVGLVWRALRRLGFGVDASVVAALLLGVPGIVIASCMMTNDPLCALFVTATVVRLLEAPREVPPGTRHAALTGLLAGLAAMTKASGAAAIGMAAAFYAWRSRREPRRALRNVLAVGAVAVAIAGPHYVRLFLSLSGSAYHIVGTRAGSQEKELIGMLVYSVAPTRRLFPSYAALLHASLWGDPMAVYLPYDPRIPSVALSIAGLLVTAIAALGAARLLVRRELASRAGAALVFGVLYAAALLPLVRIGPYMVLTKVNYMLPEALPAAILVATGLEALRRGFAVAARAMLLAIAVAGVAVTWYGWWEPARPEPRTAELAGAASPDSPLRTVERYFACRARDPIRAASLLTEEAHLAHGLRLARMLRLRLAPEPGLDADAERSLEFARARVAWLDLYNLVAFVQPIAAALDVRVVGVTAERDTADVTVRVDTMDATPPSGGEIGLWPFPPFEQRFTLRRDGADWRIADVAQRDVVNENAVQAFVAYPTLDGLEGLRSIGWKPDWEDAVAAFMRALP